MIEKEINELNTIMKRKLDRNKEETPQQFYQVGVFYVKDHTVGAVFKTTFGVSYPYYSQEIFFSEEQAQLFIPYFVKELIRKELLPENVVNEDKSLDENRVRVGIIELRPTMLEKDSD